MESKRKRIYAVLWVDDYYGPSSLSSKDVEWYHQSAGPISLAVEKDDRYPWSFAKTLKPEAKGISSSDYLAHHYHPVKWKGALVPKRIFDSLRLLPAAWTVIKHFRGHFKAPVPKRPLRIGIIAIFARYFGADFLPLFREYNRFFHFTQPLLRHRSLNRRMVLCSLSKEVGIHDLKYGVE